MPRRLLVGLFFRRFIDNDLVSPDADRHEVIAYALAGLAAFGTVLTALLSMKYLLRPLQSRGWTAVVALDDTFTWVGLSMIVMAFVALAAWDSLALDARDTEILGPLPLTTGQISRAQVAALILFAATFVIGVNAVPSVAAPLVRVQKLPIGGAAVLALMAAHAVAATAAGLFGFAAVLAAREGLRAVLGPALFRRVSAIVQGSLVVVLATSFLLLPVLSSRVERRWLAPASAVTPPLWFVGLHERLAGEALIGIPPTEPPAHAPRRHLLVASESGLAARYRQRVPLLHRLAQRALWSLALVVGIAGASCAWNNRRLPAAIPVVRRGRRPLVSRLGRMLVRGAVARAGFDFALHALTRSARHRIPLATTVGIALAAAATAFHAVGSGGTSAAEASAAVLAIQTLVLVVLVSGFRYCSRLPASIDANATFILAGVADARPFRTGVKRAGVLALGGPALALLLPVHAVMLGPSGAAWHAFWGVLVLLLLMEAAFLDAAGLEFVVSPEPGDNRVALGTLYAVAALTAVQVFSSVERLALAGAGGRVAFTTALMGGWVALRAINRRGAAASGLLAAVAPGPTARLNLSE